jgi:hypothetical protein
MVRIIKETVAQVESEEGQLGLRKVFERANKAWPWVCQDDPERLCKLCLNAMLEVSFSGLIENCE